MAADWSTVWQNWLAQYGAVDSIRNPFENSAAHYMSFLDSVAAGLKSPGVAIGEFDFAGAIEKLYTQLTQHADAEQAGDWLGVASMWTAAVIEGHGLASPPQPGGPFEAWTANSFDVPLLGPQREWQQSVQHWQRAIGDQQRAHTVLLGHYRAVLVDALQRFTAFLRDDTGAPLESLREIYDAWIDIAEFAYREAVMRDDFSRDFAAWVNAGSRVRLAFSCLVERFARELNLPTGSEIDTLRKQQIVLNDKMTETRKTIANLQAQVNRAPARAGSATKPVHSKKARLRPTQRRKSALPKGVKSVDEFDIGHILDGRD
jgi:class III poly(R)-hydroxyalkanoic acid synthase PhaE subunit